jgi:O-antigen/teichoic acid export membrane protein
MIKLIKNKINFFLSDRKFSEILTGSVWSMAAQIISTFVGMVSAILVARFYGAEVFGIVSMLQVFLMLVTIFTVLGTGTSILRLIPEYIVKYSPTAAYHLYCKTILLVIFVSLFVSIICFFASELIAEVIFKKPHLTVYFTLASVFILFRSIMMLNTQAIRGVKLIKLFAFVQILPQSINLILLLFFGLIFTGSDVPIYAMLGGITLTGIIGWVIIELSFKKIMSPSDQRQFIPLKEILAVSLPMLMTATMTFIIGQTGILMLGMFRDEVDVGFYSVAVKLASLTSFVLSAVNSMAAPKISELYHSGEISELFRVAKKSSKLIFIVTTPLLFILVLFGKLILSMLFGKEFIISYWPMFFLVVGQFINSVSGSTGIFMNMTNNQIVFRNIMLLAAILNILLNYYLIPKYGIVGAAITGMICTVLWNCSTLLFIKIKYKQTIGYLPFLCSG